MAMSPDERDAILITLRVKAENIERQLLTFVTRDEFAPIKAFVYGLAAIVFGIIATAIIRMILMGQAWKG